MKNAATLTYSTVQYAQDMARYAQDITKISSRYGQDMAELWPRYGQDGTLQKWSKMSLGSGEQLGQNVSNIVTGTKCIWGESGTKCLLTIFFMKKANHN